MIWYIVAALIVAAAVALDRISKALVVAGMELSEEVKIIPGVIRFYRTENTGAAFSMLNDHPWLLMVFTLIAMGIVAFLLIRYAKRHPLLTVSLSMILGGGISNLIDRIASGKVVDFIDFDFLFFGFFRFAVFNVADIFVTCGAVCLAVYIIGFEPKVERKLRAEKEKAGSMPGSDPETNPPEIPDDPEGGNREDNPDSGQNGGGANENR